MFEIKHVLHYWPTNQCRLERISFISFKWNKHRCTYVHLKNLFLVDVVTLLYMDEVRDMDWNPHWFIYTRNNRKRKMRKLLDHN